jgi:hypothetical protein
MSRFLILARSNLVAAAIENCLSILVGGTHEHPSPTRLVVTERDLAEDAGVPVYERLVEQIEREARGASESIPLNEVFVVVDGVVAREMSALSEWGHWSHLVALLVLAFPEIKWIFGIATGTTSNEKPLFPRESHSFDCLTMPRRDPLLDPTGLREWVRQRTNAALEGAELPFRLPRRRCLAAAIDDEKIYCYTNAYISYKFGFRADVIGTWALMEDRFGGDEHGSDTHDYELLFEDMSLNFADKPSAVHLSYLAAKDPTGSDGRAKHCPKLDLESSTRAEPSRFRYLVTSGHVDGTGQRLNTNREYLKKKTHAGGHGDVLFKPVGGMFDLWEQSQLHKKLGAGDRRGYAPGFIWPPPELPVQTVPLHGAPGKLSLVAEALVDRADKVRRRSGSPVGYIQGAVLASDATEILSGLTPTMTVSALKFKHELEASVECEFLGAGYHQTVAGRTEQIRAEVSAIARGYAKKKRRRSELTDLIVILSQVGTVYGQAARFEEEMHYRAAVRKEHRLLEFRTQPLHVVFNAAIWYAETLLVSFGRFVAAIIFWLVILTCCGILLQPDKGPVPAVLEVFSGFFGGSTVNPPASWPLVVWSCATVGLGFFHLGVFVSYLYSMISRKS